MYLLLLKYSTTKKLLKQGSVYVQSNVTIRTVQKQIPSPSGTIWMAIEFHEEEGLEEAKGEAGLDQ
jgi:hypothetical protein